MKIGHLFEIPTDGWRRRITLEDVLESLVGDVWREVPAQLKPAFGRLGFRFGLQHFLGIEPVFIGHSFWATPGLPQRIG